MKISEFISFSLSLTMLCASEVNANNNEEDGKQQEMVLVNEGKAAAVIVVPANASSEVKRGADELRKSITEITGVELAICGPGDNIDDEKYIRIHVGPNKIIQNKLPDLEECEADGAWISALTPRDLAIVGSTPVGTEYGVYGFLEHYCGVRWFLPGPNGKYTPAKKKLSIPGGINKVDNPFFTSRMYSAPTFWGLNAIGEEAKEMDMEWFRHNRMKQNHSIHHSLWKIFHPQKFAKEHPEFYPDKSGSGERYIPPMKGSGLQLGWQPCMSNAEVIDIAAKAAIDFFNKNPDKIVFSLGVNDHNGFCRCTKCLQVNKNKSVLGKNGLISYSNLYFSFVNKVAEKVSEKYPDRYIGCLAYAWCRDYPDFKIHPQVAVIYTMNTDGNFDAINRQDMEQVFKYAESCGIFGVYTYLYGKGYKIPVLWTGILDEFVDQLAEKNTKWWYAETYQNWGMDGIKYYLLAQKLWEPSRRFDAMLAEFCDSMFGRGSNEIHDFFEICRIKWESQSFTSVGSYNSLLASSQRVVFDSNTCNDLLRLLRVAREKTDSEKGRFLCDMFIMNIQHSRALALLQERRLQLIDGKEMKTKDVLDAFFLVNEVRKTYDVINESSFSAFRVPRGKALPNGVNEELKTIAGAFFLQCNRSDSGEQQAALFFEGIKGEPEAVQKHLKDLYSFLLVENEVPELLKNPGFENIEADGISAKEWKNGSWAGKGPVENIFIVPQAANGSYCYYFNGIKHTMGYYPRPMIENKGLVKIQEGKTYVLRAKMKFTRNEKAGVFPQASVYVVFSDGNRKKISTKRLPIPTGRRWFDAVWIIDSPMRAVNMKLTFLPLQGVGEAWMDDVSFKVMLPE